MGIDEVSIDEVTDAVAADIESRAGFYLRREYPELELDGVRVTKKVNREKEYSFHIELRDQDKLDPKLVQVIISQLSSWLQQDYQETLTPPTFREKLKDLFSRG